jgi:hypothetical protein
VCLCVSEREREREFEIQIDSRWFVTAYTSFIRSSYLLPALILFEPFIFLVVAVIGVVLFERTLDLVISFYNLVFMMNSFVNSSLSSVSAHFHTPTELNTPKSIQFQNEKKNSNLPRRRDIFPEIIKFLLPVIYPFSLQQCITCDYQHTRVKRHTIK